MLDAPRAALSSSSTSAIGISAPDTLTPIKYLTAEGWLTMTLRVCPRRAHAPVHRTGTCKEKQLLLYMAQLPPP